MKQKHISCQICVSCDIWRLCVSREFWRYIIACCFIVKPSFPKSNILLQQCWKNPPATLIYRFDLFRKLFKGSCIYTQIIQISTGQSQRRVWNPIKHLSLMSFFSIIVNKRVLNTSLYTCLLLNTAYVRGQLRTVEISKKLESATYIFCEHWLKILFCRTLYLCWLYWLYANTCSWQCLSSNWSHLEKYFRKSNGFYRFLLSRNAKQSTFFFFSTVACFPSLWLEGCSVYEGNYHKF